MFFNPERPRSLSQSSDVVWNTDGVIPFNVKREVCQNLFASWAKELWFAPSDLVRNAVLSEFKTVYVPYWLFEVDTVTRYSCKIGISDRTLEDKEASINHWNLTSGTLPQTFKDILICASNCKEASLLLETDIWKLDQLQSFTLKHAEGAEVKPFHLESEKSWKLAKKRVEKLTTEACEKKLRGNTRSNNLSDLIVNVSFSSKKSRRLFVPMYSTTYQYRGKSYLFIVNGSTAKSHGQRPYSTSKLASISVTGIGAAIGFISSRINP